MFFSKKNVNKNKTKILIIGALGQIGSVLTANLGKIYGYSNVIATDIRECPSIGFFKGPFEIIDATSYDQLFKTVQKHSIDTVYLMAAMLSAKAEKQPERAWHLNMSSLFNVLNLAKDGNIKRIFWPSSIAVFGPSSPKQMVPQTTVMEPTTVYGMSKLAGERWCEYYQLNHAVDVRSLRYPGIIGWESKPGGGTTDYAVDIFHKAVQGKTFSCFLKPKTQLPMLYMDDAICATISIMGADKNQLSVKSSYNIAALSFTPEELYKEIQKKITNFKIEYKPDFRQSIADSWPGSIDDSVARQDWGWQPAFDLKKMTQSMLENLRS